MINTWHETRLVTWPMNLDFSLKSKLIRLHRKQASVIIFAVLMPVSSSFFFFVLSSSSVMSVWPCISIQCISDLQHDISNNVVCATSKGSDKLAHTHSLTRAFASVLDIL